MKKGFLNASDDKASAAANANEGGAGGGEAEKKSKDLYAILGVSKNATDKEITKAYRKIALKYHPGSWTPTHLGLRLKQCAYLTSPSFSFQYPSSGVFLCI